DRGIVVRIARGGAGNLVVVRAAARGIDVPRDAVAAAVDRERTAAEPRRGIRTELDRGGEPVFRYRLRDAVRDGVHDAADGPAAVEQRRRAAEDLDLPRGDGIDGGGVIGADGRDIERLDAVLHDPDARTGKTADHRPRRDAAEIRRAHAELAGER